MWQQALPQKNEDVSKDSAEEERTELEERNGGGGMICFFFSVISLSLSLSLYVGGKGKGWVKSWTKQVLDFFFY